MPGTTGSSDTSADSFGPSGLTGHGAVVWEGRMVMFGGSDRWVGS